MKIAIIQIKRYVSTVLENEASIKYVDFDRVLGMVIEKQIDMTSPKTMLASYLKIKRWLGGKTITVAKGMMGKS